MTRTPRAFIRNGVTEGQEGLSQRMTVVDSPEKILFASTTQAFLQKEVPLSRVRELHSQGVSFEPAWWRRAADLGWTALLVPEELGGGSVSGDGVADLAMVAEQLGKTVAPGPLYPVSTVLAALVDSADPAVARSDHRRVDHRRNRRLVGGL